jgi:hypothetical protein
MNEVIGVVRMTFEISNLSLPSPPPPPLCTRTCRSFSRADVARFSVLGVLLLVFWLLPRQDYEDIRRTV